MPIEIETKDELSISINWELRSYKIFRMGSPIDSGNLPSFIQPENHKEWENTMIPSLQAELNTTSPIKHTGD